MGQVVHGHSWVDLVEEAVAMLNEGEHFDEVAEQLAAAGTDEDEVVTILEARVILRKALQSQEK